MGVACEVLQGWDFQGGFETRQVEQGSDGCDCGLLKQCAGMNSGLGMSPRACVQGTGFVATIGIGSWMQEVAREFDNSHISVK